MSALSYLSLHEYNKDALSNIDKVLKEFVKQASSLYSADIIKINLHQLTHLINFDIKLWGPLWTHSAFPYESMNGIFVSFIHGTQKFPKNAIKTIMYMQSIDVETSDFEFQHQSAKKLYYSLQNDKEQ